MSTENVDSIEISSRLRYAEAKQIHSHYNPLRDAVYNAITVVAMVHRVMVFGASVEVYAAGEELALPELRVGRAAGRAHQVSSGIEGVVVRHYLRTVRQLMHVAGAECSRLAPPRRAHKMACGLTNRAGFPNHIHRPLSTRYSTQCPGTIHVSQYA